MMVGMTCEVDDRERVTMAGGRCVAGASRVAEVVARSAEVEAATRTDRFVVR